MPALARDLEPRVHGVRPAARPGASRCRSRASTPGWASSGWRACSSRSPATSTPTCSRRSTPGCASSSATTPTPSRRSGSATRSSPTTPGPITFLIADGVLPSNEGRGYVLRRIVRRAVRHGRLLGRASRSSPTLATVVVEIMADAYPYLRERETDVLAAIEREEAQFARTLDAGTGHLEAALAGLTTSERLVGRRADDLPADAPALAGDVAFRLHDTYGFPIDLTIELAAEHGVRVDRAGFEAALAEQRERSRGGRKAELAKHADGPRCTSRSSSASATCTSWATRRRPSDGRIVAIVREGIEYQELTGNAEVEIVLDSTPFYAEGGGQVGDTGELREEGGGSVLVTVEDTTRPVGAQGAASSSTTAASTAGCGSARPARRRRRRATGPDDAQPHGDPPAPSRAAQRRRRARAAGRLAGHARLPALRLPARARAHRDELRAIEPRSGASSATPGPSRRA